MTSSLSPGLPVCSLGQSLGTCWRHSSDTRRWLCGRASPRRPAGDGPEELSHRPRGRTEGGAYTSRAGGGVPRIPRDVGQRGAPGPPKQKQGGAVLSAFPHGPRGGTARGPEQTPVGGRGREPGGERTLPLVPCFSGFRGTPGTAPDGVTVPSVRGTRGSASLLEARRHRTHGGFSGVRGS